MNITSSIENIAIVVDDEQFVVIHKPAGVVVNRSETSPANTLQDWIEAQSWFAASNDPNDEEFRARSGIVHRLDKETSGVLVIAKTPNALRILQSQFHDRVVKKTYLALVHGELSVSEGIIVLPLGRSPETRGRFVVDPHGRTSETKYTRLGVYRSKQGEMYSYVRLEPKTGRTHQIRVHMKHIGHPLVGDPLYLGRRRTLEDREWCPRQFLHAETLQFEHPLSSEKVFAEAGLPTDLVTALTQLDQI